MARQFTYYGMGPSWVERAGLTRLSHLKECAETGKPVAEFFKNPDDRAEGLADESWRLTEEGEARLVELALIYGRGRRAF